MPRKVAKAKDVGVDKEKSVGKKDVVKRGRKMRGGEKLLQHIITALENNSLVYDDIFDKIIGQFDKIVDDLKKKKDRKNTHISQIGKFKLKNIQDIPSLLDLKNLLFYINKIEGYDKIDINILYSNIIILYIYNFFELIKDIIENNNVDIDIDDKVALPVVDNTKDKAIEELATATTAKDKAIEELATATTAKDKAERELATATTAKEKAEKELAEEKKTTEAANAAKEETNRKLKEAEEKYKLLEDKILTIDEDYFKNALDEVKKNINSKEFTKVEKKIKAIIAIWEILRNDSIIKNNNDIKEIIEEIKKLNLENNDKLILSKAGFSSGGKRKINSSRTKRK
jgi:hypothetical protein